MLTAFYTKISSKIFGKLKTRGFGLIEVMISAMVLSIALLGIASIQSRSMALMIETNRQEVAAGMRAQIYLFALRANQDGLVHNFAPARWDSSIDGNSLDLCRVEPNNFNDDLGNCSPNQFYQNLVFQWQNNLSQILPSGRGCVCFDTRGVSSTNFSTTPIRIVINTGWVNLAGEQVEVSDTHEILTEQYIEDVEGGITSCVAGVCPLPT